MVILNVDDDADDREFFLDAINEISPLITCLTAGDGIEAQELWGSNPKFPSLDFIFLDINMPKMDGIELLEVMRRDDRFEKVPVYILSTSSDEREMSRITSLGARCISKQGSFQEIVAGLSSIICPQQKNTLHIKLVPKGV